MTNFLQETYNSIEKLEKNPNSSGKYDNNQASRSIFNLFCQLNVDKIKLSLDEKSHLKDLIRDRSGSFGVLLADMDEEFGFFEGLDEWRGFSVDRSTLQFIIELFEGDLESLRPELAPEDFLEFDERLMEIAEMEGCYPLEKIPKGVPDSHWWWSRAQP